MNKTFSDARYEVQEIPQDFYYYLKVVPHEFMDFISQERESSYSYSLSANIKRADAPRSPQATLIIDYAPLKVVITRRKRELGQFLINVCSILGGVGVLCGLLNSFTQKCIERCQAR